VSTKPPVPLAGTHDLSRFDCGKQPLNDWLRERALQSEGRSARCFVVCDGKQVTGYYCLSAGAVERDKLAGKFRRNMPSAVPVIVLGRLAIDKSCQGRGIGRGLLKDALLRVLAVSKDVGARALLVHAIDDEIVPFYRAYGFQSLTSDTRTLFLPIETIVNGL
jgi:GNAT superfamily N-acetyltransferase